MLVTNNTCTAALNPEVQAPDGAIDFMANKKPGPTPLSTMQRGATCGGAANMESIG